MIDDGFATFKQRQREAWASFTRAASLTIPVAGHLIPFADVTAGEAVLDVGCGTGVAAITAARAGAKVSALDLTPALLEQARENQAIAGVEVAWTEGDAEALGPDTLPEGGGGFLGEARIASTIDQPGAGGVGQAWIARILPRGVTYEGRIHEQPVSALPRRRLPLTLGHDGYTVANLARKGARNETLLMRELGEAPEDPYLWFQLAKEHQARGRAPQAALCFAEALRLAPADAGYRHALVVRAMMALKANGQLAEALRLADAEVRHWPDSPDFYFVIGDLYLEAASREPDRALGDFLPVVESAWKRCLEIGERPDLDGAVAGRGGHMAAYNLAVFYETLGRDREAADYADLAARLNG